MYYIFQILNYLFSYFKISYFKVYILFIKLFYYKKDIKFNAIR